MGKLNGTQHLMRAVGVDPENPLGSLLEKAGVNPDEILAIAHAIPEILRTFESRQQRMENGLAEIAFNQQRILSLLENQRALPAGDITPVADDVSAVLDSFHARNLGEPSNEVQNAEGLVSH